MQWAWLRLRWPLLSWLCWSLLLAFIYLVEHVLTFQQGLCGRCAYVRRWWANVWQRKHSWHCGIRTRIEKRWKIYTDLNVWKDCKQRHHSGCSSSCQCCSHHCHCTWCHHSYMVWCLPLAFWTFFHFFTFKLNAVSISFTNMGGCELICFFAYLLATPQISWKVEKFMCNLLMCYPPKMASGLWCNASH